MSPSRAARADEVLEAARATPGFMPDEEGQALAAVAGLVARLSPAAGGDVIVEVGAYCGRSTLYLASGVLRASGGDGAVAGPVIFSVDHHHGSEENQAGWEHHDPSLVDPVTGRMDTLPNWRRAVESAGLEDQVVGLVGDSPTIAAAFRFRGRPRVHRRWPRRRAGLGGLPRLGTQGGKRGVPRHPRRLPRSG